MSTPPGSRRSASSRPSWAGTASRLVVARMRPYVREALDAAGVAEVIGEDRFFPTVRAAVAYCLERDATG